MADIKEIKVQDNFQEHDWHRKAEVYDPQCSTCFTERKEQRSHDSYDEKVDNELTSN